MAYEAKVLADSISPDGHRLTTMEVVFPRFVLAEFNTHRMLSRNTASSRAIPVKKIVRAVLEEPFVTDYWGVNQPGMQAEEVLTPEEAEQAESIWLCMRDHVVLGAVALIGGSEMLDDAQLAERVEELKEKYNGPDPLPRGLHKQIPNRPLEPFNWHTALVTATEWENYYALRDHPDAQPEIRQAAATMHAAHVASEPKPVDWGQWHLPLIQEDEKDLPVDIQCEVSAGRCARVSYLTHDNRRAIDEDIRLQAGLLDSGHMSPFEHVATPRSANEEFAARHANRAGNFVGWKQYRKTIPGEHNFAIKRKQEDPTYDPGI